LDQQDSGKVCHSSCGVVQSKGKKITVIAIARINTEKATIYTQTKHQLAFSGSHMCGMANNGGEPNILGFKESINLEFDSTNVNVISYKCSQIQDLLTPMSAKCALILRRKN
jgi:hypothetical protein